MAIYLDYNATTPIDAEVQTEICTVLKQAWGNPSSSYSIGKEAKHIVEDSRRKIANMIGAKAEEIIFTSGGTESNNMVIQTIIHDFSHDNQANVNGKMEAVPHIISTNVEHDSVKLPLEVFLKEGKIDVTFVPVSKETGVVDVKNIINEIRPNTRLITVMLANNETGMIQPVEFIKDYLKSLNRNSKYPIYLHTDAAQAIGKINVDVRELDIDYLTIVGHKFYGPRIGALYFKKSCPLHPMFYGGGQESNLRPGTENTCMIAGLGKAAELVSLNLHKYNNHFGIIGYYLKESLMTAFSDKVIFNLKSDSMLPNTLSVAFDYDGITGKMLLDEASNIYASTGAACHSGDKPSAILMASGISADLASKTLRLSVGRETTEDDIDAAVKYLKEAIFNLSSKLSI